MCLLHELRVHLVTKFRPLVQRCTKQLVCHIYLGVPVDRLLSIAAVQQDAVKDRNGL